MSDRPTPMTDAALKATQGLFRAAAESNGFARLARELERELAESQTRLNDTLAAMAMLGDNHERELADSRAWSSKLADLADDLRADLAEAGDNNLGLSNACDGLKRELDNAESDRKQAEADTLRAMHERNEAREQRDRLAEAAKAVVKRWNSPLWNQEVHTGVFIRELSIAIPATEGKEQE